MDDYHKTRDRTSTSIVTITLTGATQEIWGQNPRRRSIILFTLSGYTLWLSYVNPAAINTGLPVSNQTYPYIFDQDRFGDFCTHTVFGISSVASVCGILEVFDDAKDIDLSKYDPVAAQQLEWENRAWTPPPSDGRIPVGQTRGIPRGP